MRWTLREPLKQTLAIFSANFEIGGSANLDIGSTSFLEISTSGAPFSANCDIEGTLFCKSGHRGHLVDFGVVILLHQLLDPLDERNLPKGNTNQKSTSTPKKRTTVVQKSCTGFLKMNVHSKAAFGLQLLNMRQPFNRCSWDFQTWPVAP